MNANQFTLKAQEVLQNAQLLAQENEHQTVEDGHLLDALISTDDNVIPFVFKQLQLNLGLIYKLAKSQVKQYAKVQGGELGFSPKASQILLNAWAIAKKNGDEFVATDHLLITLFESSGPVGKMLKDQGITRKALDAAIAKLRQGEKVTSASMEDRYNALDKYAVDLTKRPSTVNSTR